MRSNPLSLLPILGIILIWSVAPRSAVISSTRSKGQCYEGSFTREIRDCELVVPHRANSDGTFLSYSLPQFYQRTVIRRKREIQQGDHKKHYVMTIEGVPHHVELWPNHGMMSPNLVIEHRSPNISEVKARLAQDQQCHYVGQVRGHKDSRASLSVCDGLAGYVRVRRSQYYIEPAKASKPKEDGQHLHLVHRASDHEVNASHPTRRRSNCDSGDDWERDWKERLRWEFKKDPEFFKRSIQRRSESKHRYVETSLVADKKFVTYHKDRDIENYVLTLFNMALLIAAQECDKLRQPAQFLSSPLVGSFIDSIPDPFETGNRLWIFHSLLSLVVTTLYHDNSIGNLVDVVLTRIIYLDKEEEEIDLEISRDAGKTLLSFCNWIFGLNPPERRSPHHFDVAVLLTRHDICSDNMKKCSLLGLAYTASACRPTRGCSINEDVGLLTGNTITHEMGHNLGCTHDIPERTGCTNRAKDNSYYVMSPYVMMNTNSWSACSKKYMSTFFETGLGDCLLNEPVESSFKIPDMPPGALYDGTYQCQERFGNQAEICPLSGDRMCKQLLCKVGKFCVGSGLAPADGTRCGENQWCFDTKCVEAGKRIEAIHGHWGSWGPWGECSRTCGGGIESQERDCDNPKPQHRGRYCVGERKRSRICNIRSCALNAPSFREVQCAEYNGKHNGKIWKPYWSQNKDFSADTCELRCINEKAEVERLDIRVKDGTRCRVGTRDTCVSGRCRKVGCDWKLDSDEIEDECGICKGNGTGCQLVEATFSETRGEGYETIVRIPKGSTKIHVHEVRSSGNLIAVKDNNERYLLNGERKEQPDGQYSFGDGVIGVYTHVEPKKEELIIKGPTDKELILQTLFTGSDNPGIKYSFFQRGSNASYHPVYEWEFFEWSDCSAHCGGGTQVSKASCVEAEHGQVSDTFCNMDERPKPITRSCNMHDCKYKWRAADWGPCLPSGHQERDVDCVKENAELSGEDVVSDTKHCKGKRPYSSQKCDPKLKQEEVYKSPALKPYTTKKYEPGSECPPVVDNIGPDTFKFIQVPLIDDNETAEISEEAEEEIGDMLSHKIDFEKMVIYAGDEADKKTKEVRDLMREDA